MNNKERGLNPSFLFTSRQNTGIRIRVVDAFSSRLLLLTKIEVEGDIQQEHTGKILGESQLLVGSQLRQILHALMIVVGKRIHYHSLHRPLVLVIAQGHGMNGFALIDGLSPKFVIGSKHVRHQRPMLVHADDAATETPIAMRMRVGIPFADVAVKERIQADRQILLDRLQLDISLNNQAMEPPLIVVRTDKHTLLIKSLLLVWLSPIVPFRNAWR